jgi:polyribonucleotide nucleotidyltransferase
MMEKLFIDKEFIGAVIGPQGKVIQEIQRITGATINIEGRELGEVSIFSPAKEGLDKAVAWIKGITAMPVVGDVYEAIGEKHQGICAFVEFLPGKQGFAHQRNQLETS